MVSVKVTSWPGFGFNGVHVKFGVGSGCAPVWTPTDLVMELPLGEKVSVTV